jgi:S-adenosylmethionine synthetase
MSQPAERPHVAEDVLPGHPDRVCDAIAERIVDDAVAVDDRALVGVEVALFRESVVVTGRIAASRGGPCGTGLPPTFREQVIYEAFEAAGYQGPWAVSGLPKETSRGENVLRLLLDLETGELSCEESGIRGFSDDQNIVVGHASGSEQTGWLPPAPFVARKLREALGAVSRREAERLGPDGKVLVRFIERDGAFRWSHCNVAVQHAPGVGYDTLHALVVPALHEAAKEVEAALPGLGASFRPEDVRLNGGGDFSCGGPRGDNGLSGKKLVVDHYGPGVPIGGGALCGKDPHKVDRAGALRARQLAVRLVRDAGAREATVRLGFFPGLEAPAWMDAFVDGAWWDADRIARAVTVPDLSLEGTVAELELTSVRWSEVARAGYFGNAAAWER